MVVNGFLHTGKFEEIYEYLVESAKRHEIDLTIRGNHEIMLSPSEKEVVGCDDLSEYDFCLFWDKDLSLARGIEKQGLRCFNSARAIEICDDKSLTFECLKEGLMPMTITLPMTYENVGYSNLEFWSVVEKRLNYPIVIKECHGSFGAQVYLANDREEAYDILTKNAGRPMIAQDFIKESFGRDVRINMVADRAVAAMERFHETDFRANVTNGGRMKPHEVTEEELTLCRKVMKMLHLDFAGVDLLFSDEGPMICEVNSNAHFKNIYDCTGVNVADAIFEYILSEIGE